MQWLHYAQFMPTLKRFHSCRLEIRHGDHNPPHFHVVFSDGREAMLQIDGLRVLAGRLKLGELAMVRAWVEARGGVA